MEPDQEQKINIRGININYLKIGNGEHTVLLMPGTLVTTYSRSFVLPAVAAFIGNPTYFGVCSEPVYTLYNHAYFWYVGSIRKDFTLQVEQLDRNKFTIVAWDPPGYGNSRPPNREFSEDFLEKDASLANELMQTLGFKTFSTIGFCNGGRTSLVLAALYPDSIQKIILISTNTFLTPDEMAVFEISKDFTKWPETIYAMTFAIYGENYFKDVWHTWITKMLEFCEKRNGDICTNFLDKVHCPVLLVRGTKDRLIHESHLEFLNKKIRNSRVHIFDNGAHAVHVSVSKEFNELATNFLLSN